MSSNPEAPNPKSGEGESAVRPDPILGAVEANAGWDRGLVEHSRDLLCIHDLEGRLLSVNPEPARQVGYTVEELLRIPMRELVPPEFRPQFLDYLKKVARKGEAHGLLTILTRSGERRVWEYHNTLRTEGQSAPVVCGVAHDVTDRRRIEHELRKTAEGFRLLEEYAPALAMFDREMRYLYASRRWRTDYGLGDRDLRGLSHYDVFPEIPERWKQAHRRGLAGEVLREEHDRFDRADGSTQWVRWEIRPWYETTDTIGGIVIFSEDVTDITERKQAEEALRASAAELQEAQRVAHMGSWRSDVKTQTVSGSEQMYRIMGVDPGRAPQSFGELRRFFPPDTWQRIIESNQRAAQTGKPEEIEIDFLRPDGTTGWLLVRGETNADEAGNVVAMHGIALDITERKRAEKDLQAHQVLIAQAQDAAHLGCFDLDMKNNRGFWSPEQEKIYGLAPGTFSGQYEDWRAMVLPEDREKAEASIAAKMEGGETSAEFHIRHQTTGEIRWVEAKGRIFVDRDGKPSRMIGINIDITDRKHAEEALQASEERYRSVVSAMAEGILLRNADGRILACNRSFEQMLGVTSEQMVGTTAADWEHRTIHEDGSPFPAKDHPAMVALRTGRPQSNICMGFRRQDTGVIWISINAQPIFRSGESKPNSVVTTFADITERKCAEQALRESEERMRLAHEAAKIGTFERNMQTGEGYWTRQTEEMFGLEPGAGPKSIPEFLSLIHPEDRKHVENLFAESIATGSVAGEWRVIWPDGSVHWIDGRWKVLKDEQGRPLRAVGIDSDITERKQTEEALRRSEESYRNFVTQSSEGIFRQDVDAPIPIDLPEDELLQRILHDSYMAECNGAMVKMYGLNSVGDFQGRRLTEFLDPDNPRNIELTREYIRSGFRILERESREADARGNPKVFRNSLIGIVEDGKLVRTWGIQRDVTEQVQAEEALRQSEERFRVALSGSPIAVFNQDSNLHYTWVYNLMKGSTPEDYLGKTDEEVFGPETGARMRALKQKTLATGQSVREELSVAAHASRWYLDMTIEPLREESGRIVGVTSVCVDVSHLHRIANELRQAKDKLTEEKLYLEHAIDSELGFEEIIGKSDGMKAVMELVAQVATSEATVLLLGETGVGKELVARAIHRLSSRTGHAFIKMNCAAIPTGLLESELFGAEKGAYTGSVSRKIGRLELADKGSLFLDEIGEIALQLQPKLLRVLQDQEFERLGGTQTLKVNFRLIAATNRDLAEEVKHNQFRSDLFYRLNVFPIVVPPLRHRRDDIPLLVKYFVHKCSKRMNKSITSIPNKTMAVLTAWDWPGNVRELENFIERSIILTNGSVLAAPLAELQARLSTQDQAGTLEAAERKHILEALRQSKGRISGEEGAAARLGLKRTTLQSKLKQLRINPRNQPPN